MINLLYILLGFDKDILKEKEGGFGSVFFLCFLYILLLPLSLYGCYYAGFLLLGNFFTAALLAIFLTYILHNMYRLIIATSYEGNNLTTIKEIYKYISEKGFLVVILSIFISCSLCVSLFNSEINMELDQYKSNLVLEFDNLLNTTYGNQIAELNKAFQDEKEFNLLVNQKGNINDSLALQNNLLKIEQLKQNKIETLNNAILASNFFIRQIIIIAKQPKFWFLTILIVLLYLLPLYLFNRSAYFLSYQLAVEENNKDLVLEEYNSFKNTYVNLLSAGSGQEITINERYEDPPFNTMPITREDMILQKGSLLEWLKKYHG